MVHPAELIRSTSEGIRNIVAPAGNYLNDIDCGLRIFPYNLSERLKLERFAKLGVFVVVLAACGFFQEVLLMYFRGTAELWGEHHGISKDLVGWFIYTSEVYAGIFALGVAYWGNRIHRACWIGGLTIFLALAAATLAIPEIYKPYNANEIDRAITGFNLCTKGKNHHTIVPEVRKHFTIDVNAIMIQIFQVFMGLASISYYSLGISYIDDHITPQHSPGYIGMAFAAKAVGKQVGIYTSWFPYVLRSTNIFNFSVWFFMMSLTLMFGIVIILFPKELPKLAIRRSVDSLVSLAIGRNANQEELVIDGFFKSMMRILKNKFLLLNLMAYTLIQTALINFRLFENAFNQSKYHSTLNAYATNYNESGLNQFTSYLLEQPIVAIFSATTGLMLAKIRPKAKYIVIWNMIVFLLIGMMFTSTVFWECLDVDDNDVKITRNNTIIKIKVTCVSKHNCKLIQALTQVNSVIISGLMASVAMSNTIINMRSVEIKDTSLAIGLQYTFTGLIPYLFVRSIYYFGAEGFFCLIEGGNGCQYYSTRLAIFLSALTTALIFLAVLTSGAVLYVLHDIQLYETKQYSDSRDIDIVHLTMADTAEGNTLCNGPLTQLNVVSGPFAVTGKNINEKIEDDRTNETNEEYESIEMSPMNRDDPQPSTSRQVMEEISLDDIFDTLGDDFDSDPEEPGDPTKKPGGRPDDEIDSPIPEKFAEEILQKQPKRIEFPSFSDIKQFSYRNRLAPIKESHEREPPKHFDSDSDEDFTSAIEMVVLKKKEDVKETYGKHMLE